MGRFLNADSYASTGQGIIGNNMYAYCGNNPVARNDKVGKFWNDLFSAIGNAFTSMAPAYATCAGVAVADGPLPFLDGAALVVTGALTIGTIGVGIYQGIKELTKEDSKAEEKEEEKIKDEAIPKIPKGPVIFPINPNDFNPVGLVKVPRAATINGALISWMNPLTNIEVFRWDENPRFPNGPHYHIYGKGHYIPGIDTVPEPYAAIYFPLG